MILQEPPAPQAPLHVIALAIVIDGDRVLVTRRPRGEHLEGLWEFPGGKVREGEPAEEAARRELREEAGLEIPPGAFEPLTFVHHDYGDRRVLLLAFVARMSAAATSEVGHAGDGRESRWIPLGRLNDLRMPEANGAIVAALPGGVLPRSDRAPKRA